MKTLTTPTDHELYGGDYFQKFLPKTPEDVRLDFVGSDDISELESGIRSTVRGVEIAVISIGLALAKIMKKGLYIEAGFRSFSDYLENADDRLSMPKQTASDYITIAENWIRYFDQLRSKRFRLEGNITKLRLLDRAVEAHGDVVFERLNELSFREFYSTYVMPPRESIERSADFRVSAKGVFVDGAPALRFEDSVDPAVRKELTSYLKSLAEIRSRGNAPLVVELYDPGEARAIDRLIKKYRQTK